MSREVHELDGYPWRNAGPTCAHPYLLPKLENLLKRRVTEKKGARVLDLGCGNGAVTGWLADRGFSVLGVDPSSTGIAQARAARPDLQFMQASAYELDPEELGVFDIAIALEVIEHVYDPGRFARTAYNLLIPGGTLLISTPYHGWLKNTMIAVSGRFDDHVNPLRMHGHIKFWSRATLTRLLEGAGFEIEQYHYAGRIRPLAKSMLVVARRLPEA